MHTTIGRTAAAVLTALALATTMAGCSAGGSLTVGKPDNGSGGLLDQASLHSSALASALDLIPDMPDGYVMYTDWSLLGHRAPRSQDTTPFASALLSDDDMLQRDLGIRSTNADWEIEMWQLHHFPTIVLHFNRNTDLAGLAGKLIRFGYHASGSIFTGAPDQRRTWTYALRNVGISADRRLLVAGSEAATVRSVLAGPGSSLSHDGSLTPLLAVAVSRLGRIATASLTVGPGTCVTLEELLLGKPVPATVFATVRKALKGTFTRPLAEITALGDPPGGTALNALTFPDQTTAQANRAGRSGAAALFNASNPRGVRVTGSTVAGRVLSFTLTATQPGDIVAGVQGNSLGVDICL